MAHSAAVPPYAPQLATLVDEAPEGDEWLHEEKYDGYRIGARVAGGRLQLVSRNGQDWTAEFPTVAAAIAGLGARNLLLDGEVAIVGPNGVTSFQALQRRSMSSLVTYFVFDVMHLEGVDLGRLPLEERKETLRELVAKHEARALHFSSHLVGNGAAYLEDVCRRRLEGMVSKRRTGHYRPGRNLDWRKTKCGYRQELVVGGFTEPEGAREGLGALLLGYYKRDRLTWAGNVGTGTGWTPAYLQALRHRLEALRVTTSAFDPPVDDSWLRKHALWVRPELVVEVAFAEWTADGRVRHPSVQGVREDKNPADVRRERPTHRSQRG
jgi:bifunctional non-homologous end joining protein LigD